ncbi:HAMP domain-containing sensor histidine kinase [Cellulomonas sp.]|uniref:HAMP domain-containing sensor histidine kinase n=1 Tax=Cellulomonas sp. TaxID=40001 RepID=UPI003BAC69FD
MVQHLRTVRARSSLVAMAAVALALVLACLGLLVVLHASIARNALAAATTRAHDVATELTTDGAVTDGLNLEPGPGDDAYIQLVGSGTVVAASPEVAGYPPLTTGPAGTDGPEQVSSAEIPGPGEGPYVTVALGVEGVSGVDTVIVRQSYADGNETVTDAAQAMLVIVPLLVIVVGLVTYLLTGRALRPVEQIRARTAQIGEADLDTRIDVPATGDEIARLAVTLNEMLDRLHAAQQARVRFVADASHELRSPLAAARAELDVAARDPDHADWQATARVLRTSNERMQQLVDDLLVLTRTAEGGAPRSVDDVDLDDVVERVGFALRPPEGVSVEVSTEPVRVHGSLDELVRAVQNLADNAVRHAHGRVRLSVRGADGRAQVEVADDGDGIDVEDRDLVFDRFVRLDEGRARSAGGSGLGLAIVRGIVESHGGTVRVVGSDLGGAAFVVELPRTQSSATTR